VVGPPCIWSFGIKDLAIVFARSLRNKDFLVKYFSVNELERFSHCGILLPFVVRATAVEAKSLPLAPLASEGSLLTTRLKD
jgi:hypothetical protein